MLGRPTNAVAVEFRRRTENWRMLGRPKNAVGGICGLQTENDSNELQ